MKKIAVLMILVLCAVMLGGCMGSGAGTSVADAVAFAKFGGVEEINLTLDKEGKVLVVTYGKDKVKADTVYKDSEIVGKALDEAVVQIIKANENVTALSVSLASASGKDTDEFKKVKDEVVAAGITKAFEANEEYLDLKITYGEVVVLDKKAADFTATPDEGGEETSSEAQ